MCGAPADLVITQTVSPITPAGMLIISGPVTQEIGACVSCAQKYGELWKLVRSLGKDGRQG